VRHDSLDVAGIPPFEPVLNEPCVGHFEQFSSEKISLFALVSDAAPRRLDQSLNFFLGKAC
jgi:hypothetical protein